MPRRPHSSPQALALFAALVAAPDHWRHGVSLTQETGLKPGTLYPLLIRLNEAGFLEAEWRPPERPGRPARHVYRLTAAGRALAAERLACGAAPVIQTA
jgi:PadR family transcriptional regulator PadR